MNNERRLFLRKVMGYTGSALILPTFLTACGGSALILPTFLTACGGGEQQTSQDAIQVDTTANQTTTSTAPKTPFFKISLAEWSLHKMLFEKKLDNLDFPAKAKNDFGIDAVEYVNQFFKDKAKDNAYLTELKKRAD
nr:hypothetical protein [Thermoflexibacter sp.]